MRKRSLSTVLFALLLVFPSTLNGQTRDEKVRNDRESLKNDTSWFYDDLAAGIEVATKENKPLMVVLRCIP